MILLWIIFAYIIVYYIREYLEKRKSPPGPLPIPILGNCIQVGLASDIPHLAIAKIAEKYGEIFQLKVGVMTMVVPATSEAIETILSRSECQARDCRGSWEDRNFGKNLGVVFSSGPFWEKSKAWLLRSLREYGVERPLSIESSTKIELEPFFNKLEESRLANGGIVEVTNIFLLPVFNIFWQMVTGHRTPDDDIVINNLLAKSEVALKKGILGAGIVNAFPVIRYIFPEYTGHAAFMAFYQRAHEAAKDLLHLARLDISRPGLDPSKTLYIIEAFAKKMEEEKNNPGTIFTEENFIVIFMDILQASSDTTNALLETLVLFMVLYPDVQAKIYEEIKQQVPKGHSPSYSDKANMIYTEATILEVHRFGKIVQNLVPRLVTSDFYYKKYLISKGSVVVADLHSAYNNNNDWENPLTFSPERFINKNGELINHNCKRICPGEILADTTAFVIFTSVLQNYKLSVIPGQPLPSQEMHAGITSNPFPFKISVSKRID